MPASSAEQRPREAGRRLKLVVQYDGSGYVGWERQKSGLAIQEVLEEAIFTITRERVLLDGSGRTDAGVHARAQVASCLLKRDIHLRKLMLGVNAVTPPDVSVVSIDEAPRGFHARKSARSKWYRYSILNDGPSRPLLRHFSYHHPQELACAPMRTALDCLVGTHDFTAFAKEAHLKKSCVRTILEACLVEEMPLIHIDLTGTGFLYNMVRIVVGTLIEIGQGKRRPGSMLELLEGGRREAAGFTAPPGGLCLMEVHY